MTIRLFNDVQQWPDDDGDPLNGGKIYFYEAGTTTLKDTYTSKSIGTAQANPVVLDADGRPANPIWLSGEYKYKVTNSLGVTIGIVVDNLNAETASDTVETGILVTNGSFETDSDGDGQPDNWTITALTDATIAVDTTDSVHGKNSLKFLSGGNGGGTVVSEFFDVLKAELLAVEFTYKASSATVKTIVDVYTYDKSDGLVSQLNAYTATTGNPTSYATHSGAATIDATAVRAKVVITGIDAAGTTITAGTTTHFDYIKINRELRSPVIVDEILDTNKNELIKFGVTSSAVNEITITNSATGNPPVIQATGETDIDLELTRNGTGDITVDSTPIYGMAILDTPILLATDTSSSSTAKAELDITAHTTGVAIKAIVRVRTEIRLNTSSAASMTSRVGEADETFSAVHDCTKAIANATSGNEGSDSNTVVTNLKSGEIFAWELILSGTISVHTTTVHLIGYYV